MKLLRALPMLFALMYSCHAQNGPTAPSVLLSWTQTTTTGVTGNCIYRGIAPGVYAKPALFCSPTPTLSYTDLTVVRGTTYYYNVTPKFGAAEGPYAAVEAIAPIPVMAPVTGLGDQETKLEPPIDNGSGPVLVAKVQWKRRQR